MKNATLLLAGCLLTTISIYGQILDKNITLLTPIVQENRCQCADILITESQSDVFYTVLNQSDKVTNGPIKGIGNDMTINTGPTLESTTYHILAETYDKSLNLNGTSNYIETFEMIPFTNKFSIVAKIKRNTSNGLIFGWTSPISSNYGTFEVYQNKLRYASGNTSNMVYYDSNSSLPDNTWTQVAVICNGAEIYLYVNGALIKADTYNTTIVPTPNKSFIGGGVINGTLQSFYKGNIDDLSIWNTNITLTQLSNLQTINPVGNETNLQAFYDFNVLPVEIKNKASQTLYHGNLRSLGNDSYTNDATTGSLILTETVLVSAQPNNVVANENFEFCPGEKMTVQIDETNNNKGYFLFDKNDFVAVEDTISSTTNNIELITPILNSVKQFDIKMIEADQSLNFDGVDDYIETTPMIPFSTEMTVMFRFKTTVTNSCIVAWGEGGTSKYATISTQLNHLRFSIGTGNSQIKYIDGTTIVTDGNWHNVAVTFNGKEASIYLDGVHEVSDVYIYIPTPTRFTIGAGYLNGLIQSFYNGSLNDVSVWSRILTKQEIICYTSLNPWGNDDGLLAFYNFNNLPDQKLLNRSQDNYHGTFVNMGLLSINEPSSTVESTLSTTIETIEKSNCENSVTTTSSQKIVEIYPNPASEFVSIKVKSDNHNYKIKILDSNGAVLKAIDSASLINSQLNISDLKSGIYFVEIIGVDFANTSKLIKK